MNEKSRTHNSINNVLTGLICQFIQIGVKFVNRTVFIMVLGKAFLGVSGLFADVLTMLSLTELGLDTAINFKLYKPLANKDTKRVQVIMKFYKTAYRCVGVAILLLGLCLIPFLPRLIKDYDTLAPLGINATLVFLIYLSNSVVSYFFFASRSAILKADQKENIISITTMISNVLLNIAQVFILLWTGDFMLFIALQIGFSIINNLINAVIAKRKYKEVFEKTDESLSKEEIKDIFKDLGALFASKANAVVLKATDNMVLSKFIGLVIVGTYSNYLLFYTSIRGLLAKLYNATKASIGNYFAKESVEKKYALFETVNFLTILLYGTAAIGIAVVSDEVIYNWLGTDYIIKQPFAILIGMEILLFGIKQNLMQVRNVAGLFRQLWFRPVMGIVVNLGVSIILVQFIGIYGVIIGTITADLTTNFLVDPSIIHKYGFDNYKSVSAYYIRNIRYFVELFLVGALDMYLSKHLFVGHGWWSVIVHAIICGISMPLYLFIVYRKSHEVEYLWNKAQKIILKVLRKK